ncbi:MAG: VanW family protein [Oscillospiraceae bacterium]|nr:VanW family protein [Oscillospiraceae bacterium]
MDGKRVAPVEKNGGSLGLFGKAALIASCTIMTLAIGSAVGLGIYANHVYEGIFPGVTVSDIELGGKTQSQAQTALNQNLADQLAGKTITITADGETIGSYNLAALGAQADSKAGVDQAYAIGRESGISGWIKNSLTMVKAFLGRKTEISPSIIYDKNTLSTAIDEMAERFDTDHTDASYELTSDGLYAIKERHGRTLDRDALAELLLTAQDTVEAPWKKAPAQSLDLQSMADTLSAEPLPARYDISQGKVVDGQVGVAIDVEAAQYVLDAAAEGERVKLPANVTYPEMTAEEMQSVLFRDLLATTSTNVSGSAARKGNVKLSGECVNGTILNHGDVFDYNQVVGKRTVERGFGYAGAYVNGLTVDVVGGGICQTSSTIYYATLLANLEIVDRVNHRYYPGYIPKGMDATVSWGGPDFRFKNNTGYPIRIDVKYEKSVITVSIYGTKTDDTYVKMTSEVLSTTPFETVYEETMDLPWGKQEQKQSGYTGYQVKTYRNVYDSNNNLISSTLEANNNYRSRNKIILVGINGRPEETPGTTTPDTPPPETPETPTGGEAEVPSTGTEGSTSQTPNPTPSAPPYEEPKPPETPPIIIPETMPEWLKPHT